MINKKYLTGLLIVFSAALLYAQQVVKPAYLSGSIEEQFENAFEHAKVGGRFWIGYSIAGNGDQGVFIGSYYNSDSGASLRDIIMNTKKYENDNSGNRVKNKRRFYGRSFNINDRFDNGFVPDRETAVLFRYDGDAKDINDFYEIGVCNLAHNFDLDNSPLTWLGLKDNKNSVDFLFGLYKKANTLSGKKDLLGGIGVHTGQEAVTSFLVSILNGKGESDLRKSSAIWLGLQNNNTALEALKTAVNNDTDQDVRKNAVYGIGFMKLPVTIDELVNIAKHNGDRDVRRSAVYALGNKAVKKAEQALKDFIENDPDVEIKKSAVYALANSSEDAVPYLIKIARSNKSLEVRKSAIYSLSNSDDKRALDALIELAKN